MSRLRNKNPKPTYKYCFKDGVYHIKTYRVWQAMKDRCYNPNNKRYKDYGGRGIIVCDKWINNFFAFLDDLGDPPILFGQTLTLERKDNSKNYTPENCKWASYTEQNNNRSCNLESGIYV